MSTRLSTLSDATPRQAEVVVVQEKRGFSFSNMGDIGSMLLWFVVIAVIVGFILWSLKPAWIMQKSDPTKIDNFMFIAIALGIALLITLAIWFFRNALWRRD